jgi:hypothetical protein
VLFFPALPADDAVASWTLLVHGQGDGAEVEAARGTAELPEGFEPSKPTPHAFRGARAARRLARYRGGVPTAVLSARWKDVLKSSEIGMTLSADVAFEGQYVVLASGRLLFATVRGTTLAEMTAFGRKDDVMKQRHELVASARLVSACDGLALTVPGDSVSDEEALPR